ncbi:MAG: alpha/beta hydrolase [Defluviitaleaceae bacterium]|nr:alpha/beta hydrolase [Defluviitaleaceae bacterium]MCL2836145.1 alpha/beta hydrolase [Defluviitaleaceae bacterium]
MICLIRDIPVHYVEYGEGRPVICVHGWPVDHRLMSGCLEPVFNQMKGYRRIYLDLPGMGQTPAAPWIHNSDNMLEVLIEFINTVIGGGSFLLAGESYGGRLALGLIHKMGSRIDGVLFICAATDSDAIIDHPDNLPKKRVLWQSERMASLKGHQSYNGFMDMAVISSPEIFDKFVNDIQPGLDAADWEFVSNRCSGDYGPELEEAVRSVTFDKPSCILTGRQDHVVGYKKAYELFERFPRAAYAVLDCAGHNLQIESEPLFQQFVRDWIWRTEIDI